MSREVSYKKKKVNFKKIIAMAVKRQNDILKRKDSAILKQNTAEIKKARTPLKIRVMAPQHTR